MVTGGRTEGMAIPLSSDALLKKLMMEFDTIIVLDAERGGVLVRYGEAVCLTVSKLSSLFNLMREERGEPVYVVLRSLTWTTIALRLTFGGRRYVMLLCLKSASAVKVAHKIAKFSTLLGEVGVSLDDVVRELTQFSVSSAAIVSFIADLLQTSGIL